jgi:hypothetical protein
LPVAADPPVSPAVDEVAVPVLHPAKANNPMEDTIAVVKTLFPNLFFFIVTPPCHNKMPSIKERLPRNCRFICAFSCDEF